MGRIPKNPKEIYPEIIQDYKALFGDDLISMIVYGSATGEDYRPGKSDINLMIVLSEKGIENLDWAFKIVAVWQKRSVAVPLFLTEHYVQTSLDVFPVEYLNFKRNYVLLFGKDILADLTFDPECVRLQCEREIKGKLLLLREAFLASAGKPRALKELINQSLQAFIALFEALLYLKGKEAPLGKQDVVILACDTFSLDGKVFEKLLNIREQTAKPGDGELKSIFKNYLKEVRKLSRIVDSMGG
jgi:hypothetical protein